MPGACPAAGPATPSPAAGSASASAEVTQDAAGLLAVRNWARGARFRPGGVRGAAAGQDFRRGAEAAAALGQVRRTDAGCAARRVRPVRWRGQRRGRAAAEAER